LRLTSILEGAGIFNIGSAKIDTKNYYSFVPCLIKYNILGDVLWAKQIYDSGLSAPIVLDIDNNIIIGTNDAIIKYNQSGNLQWYMKIDVPHAKIVSLVVDNDNNIYASVESTDENNLVDSSDGRKSYRHDGWLMKFNSNRIKLWSISLASDGMNSIYCTVKLDFQNNIFTIIGKYNIYDELVYLNKQLNR
jgi:hypothetical protein